MKVGTPWWVFCMSEMRGDKASRPLLRSRSNKERVYCIRIWWATNGIELSKFHVSFEVRIDLPLFMRWATGLVRMFSSSSRIKDTLTYLTPTLLIEVWVEHPPYLYFDASIIPIENFVDLKNNLSNDKWWQWDTSIIFIHTIKIELIVYQSLNAIASYGKKLGNLLPNLSQNWWCFWSKHLFSCCWTISCPPYGSNEWCFNVLQASGLGCKFTHGSEWGPKFRRSSLSFGCCFFDLKKTQLKLPWYRLLFEVQRLKRDR
jgi:hypothetical protein